MMMEHDRGFPLSQLLKEKYSFSEPKLMRVLAPILNELKREHDKGSVHQHIKPTTLYIKSDYSSGWLAPVGEEQEQDVNDERDSPRSNIAGAYAPFEFYR
ncbi:MAG: hypothetical protein KTR17_05715, partial [Cellvibrionaceae bacterium]|nr:hypothetical protein [Cellvibrionaceae bacterium]